eukprot:3709065-Amphidinium_carterae.1
MAFFFPVPGCSESIQINTCTLLEHSLSPRILQMDLSLSLYCDPTRNRSELAYRTMAPHSQEFPNQHCSTKPKACLNHVLLTMLVIQ